MKKVRYSTEALMDIFDTPAASPNAIRKWKARWRYSTTKVSVNTFSEAIKLLAETDIDPLYYQICCDAGDAWATPNNYIVFYREEHQVYFKLHNGIR